MIEFSLKMDGMWGCMIISHGQWDIYSRTGKVKATGHLKDKDYDTSETILLGEYIKNSHWGHKMDIDGNFYAFDCLKYQGLDLSRGNLEVSSEYTTKHISV